MNFIKQDIHTSLLKTTKCSEITVDEDFNIAETKGDIEKIIAKDGSVSVDEVICIDNKVKISGEVKFKVLYKSSQSNHGVETYFGSIAFDDTINADGVNKSDYAECRCKLEDIAVSVINSRKFSVRGLILNSICVYESETCNVNLDIENAEGIECQYVTPVVTESVIAKHDVTKLREDIVIPQNKPNIEEIVWSCVDIRNMEMKPLCDKVLLRGELEIFVMYRGKEEHLPIQNIFCVRGISEELECVGAREDMVVDADFSLGKGDVSIKADEDGEERIFAVDYSLDMNIKLFEDKELKMLSDMYSPQLEFTRQTQDFSYENLLLRNEVKVKIYSRQSVANEDGRIMQICHVYGSPVVDNTEIVQDGVLIEGIVHACVLYIASNEEPVSCAEVNIPFSHKVLSDELEKNTSIRVVPCLDQLVANLISGDEIEVKGQVSLGISLFKRVDTKIISDVTVAPIDYEKKAAVPGIIGYIVKKNDTLWSIARKYYTTTESIKEINGLESDDIFTGDRILIVKE